MPLVRIDIRKGKDADCRQAVGRAVYDALVSVGVEVKKENSSVGNGVAQYAP